MKVCSRGGVCVYTDYRENIIADAEHSILCWKANKERFSPSLFREEVRRDFPQGLARIGSQNSEDVLSWNLFRSLQQAGRLSLFTDMLQKGMKVEKVYFWQRAASRWSEEPDPEIQAVLNEMEPWGRGRGKQQTETDVILRGRSHVVMLECKLGKPKTMVKAWSRGGPEGRLMRPEYLTFMHQLGVRLFNESFDFELDGRRFHQLFRNYLLGAALSKVWNTDYSLVAVVNGLNANRDGTAHAAEFSFFQSKLTQPSNTCLLTWQRIYEVLPEDPQLTRLREWLLAHPLLRLSPIVQSDTTLSCPDA